MKDWDSAWTHLPWTGPKSARSSTSPRALNMENAHRIVDAPVLSTLGALMQVSTMPNFVTSRNKHQTPQLLGKI